MQVGTQVDKTPLTRPKLELGARSTQSPTSFRVNKITVRDLILGQLRAELALQTRAAQLSREEAISEESRAENQYDMHSQEAAYLAEGQARLAAEIAANIALYEGLALPAIAPDGVVALGAAVAVQSGEHRTWYFIGPRAGGLELDIDGVSVLVLTPQSPLGRELIGKHVGDAVHVQTRSGSVINHIAAIL